MSEHSGGGPRKPVDYDELFPGRFLKAGLLNGRDVTLTIASIDTEVMPQDDGKQKSKGVITFEKTDKQICLNSTNGQCLKAMFGRKVQEWVGKRITLRAEQDNFGSKKVDAIRIAGSPDIAAPITVEIVLPRRKAKQRRLEVTGASNGKPKQAPRQAPKQDRGAPYRAPEVQAEIDRAEQEDGGGESAINTAASIQDEMDSEFHSERMREPGED